MSVSKQDEVPQQQFLYQQNHTVDLSYKDRQIFNGARQDDCDNLQANRHKNETAHCAVLGYN